MHQLKSHHKNKTQLRQMNSLQLSSVNLSSFLAVIYLAAFFIADKRSLSFSLIAYLSCLVVAYSPLYDILTNTPYYLCFALIYAFFAKQLALSTNIKSKNAALCCCIMALFELWMATDRWINAGTATWTYNHYESVTGWIHLAIIAVCIDKWRLSELWRMANSAIRLRDLLRAASNCVRF